MNTAVTTDNSDTGREGGNRFRLNAYVFQDDDSISAIALNLEGICGSGDTESEALESLRKSFQAAMAVYAEDGIAPPWTTVERDDLPFGKAIAIYANS